VNLTVTGGAGFIGSHIARYLVKLGHHVTIIDNLVRGTKNNIKDFEENIDFHNLDILDYDGLKDVVKKSDGIFHEAALGSVPQSFKEPETYHKIIAIGTENILKLAKHFGFKVVYASSSSVYGNQTKFPIKEDAEKNPLNPYGEAKLAAEKFAEQYARDGVKVIGLRYFNVFGIGQNPNYAGVIPKFIERLLENKPPIINGDGSQVRSFSYIDDVVKANWLALNSKVDHAFINIASDTMTSVNDLAKLMIHLSGRQLEPEYTNSREGDIKKSQADVNLARKLIGWVPETPLEEGLKKLFQK